MRAVIQRVSAAQVRVDGQTVGKCGRGLLALICAMEGDTDADAQFIARKLAGLRIFPDAAGKMNLSALDIGGGVLAVSQFTLAADTTSGTRPSFSSAAAPAEGGHLFNLTVEHIRAAGLPVETGVFGAKMEVELTNDGPVTILLDSRNKR